MKQYKIQTKSVISYRSRNRPMQTLTQPSAPAIQAPSHAISVSFGVTTPWMSG